MNGPEPQPRIDGAGVPLCQASCPLYSLNRFYGNAPYCKADGVYGHVYCLPAVRQLARERDRLAERVRELERAAERPNLLREDL